jgi:hypothetical protein
MMRNEIRIRKEIAVDEGRAEVQEAGRGYGEGSRDPRAGETLLYKVAFDTRV